MLNALFLKGRGRSALDEDDRRILEDGIANVRAIPSRQLLVRQGQRVHVSTLLLEGFICRYMDDKNGHRQIVAVHVPGDFVDLHGFPMKRLDHDVATIGPARIAEYPHEVLETIVEQRPRLTGMLWFSTLLDAAMHREWIFRLGRLDADGRVAHFFCELNCRLEMVDLAKDGRFQLPLTQADVAEACGITGVHVNRVLRSLREQDLVIYRHGHVEIRDHKRLAALAEFDPGYLYRTRDD
ncbi:Crp/Fnr family transcriptional regulator [Sphingomonas sp.]|jgi:CRP-like cAMP-binding protein|uniref:Crp/Fnr family transcriptional regulator n=1 Tax=Sphingomonas sp. TaxID=28214 RepID=UPI002EDAC1C2